MHLLLGFKPLNSPIDFRQSRSHLLRRLVQLVYLYHYFINDTYFFFVVPKILDFLHGGLQVKDLFTEQLSPALHELQLLGVQQLHTLLHVFYLLSHVLVLARL